MLMSGMANVFRGVAPRERYGRRPPPILDNAVISELLNTARYLRTREAGYCADTDAAHLCWRGYSGHNETA